MINRKFSAISSYNKIYVISKIENVLKYNIDINIYDCYDILLKKPNLFINEPINEITYSLIVIDDMIYLRRRHKNTCDYVFKVYNDVILYIYDTDVNLVFEHDLR